MLFNSIPFLVFIFVFFCFWPFARKQNTTKWLWITCMSFMFYAWWDWRFLFLLVGTGTIDYIAGKYILNFPGNKKFWLWLSLISNISSLIVFKYSEWLASSLDNVLQSFEISADFRGSIPEFTLVLPVGISFYTFNSMSYTIDLYRGKAKPAQNILHFFAFISFFPHLVAGPIIRAKDILQQLAGQRHADVVEIFSGIRTCVWGLFQKMVLADNIAVLVNERFNDVHNTIDALQWWICMVAFAFQIYFDFNGYSSIARGIAKICGIHFKLNFNHPYFAGSFRNFWQRWHISLSSFFRDYLYIPLGGNRRGKLRNLFNLWFTMLVSGLWHGANITFLVWGSLHALYLIIEKELCKLRWTIQPVFLRKAITFTFVFIPVTVAWVFFRADNIQEAWYIITCMFGFTTESTLMDLLIGNSVFWLFVGIFSEFVITSRLHFRFRNNFIVQAFITGLLISILLFFRGPEQQFIYFQF